MNFACASDPELNRPSRGLFSSLGTVEETALPLDLRSVTSCCQKATTKHKRHQQKFVETAAETKLMGLCRDWICYGNQRKYSCMLRFHIIVLILLITCEHFATPVLAQPSSASYQLNFEDQQTRWSLPDRNLAETIARHETTDQDRHSGKYCERLTFQSSLARENQRILLSVPPATAISELTAAVWVRATVTDLRIVMRLRFPRQIDPRTGESLRLDIPGESYMATKEWQRITCRANEEAVTRRLTLERAQLASQGNPLEIDTRDAYVDEIALLFSIENSLSVIQIDDVEFGPIVQPSGVVLEPETQNTAGTRLKVHDDQILKDGQPFFPVFTLYHGERESEIREAGVNMLWIPDYADRALLTALDGMGIGAIAQPPQLTPEEAVLNRKGLPPFPEWTEPIWAWMLGFEIPPDDVRYIESWAAQVREADRQLRRPVLADVAGNERAFHRKVDLLGSSQFGIHSDISAPRHALQLKHRRNLALPGKPMFTFIQTEATSAYLDHRTEREAMPIVEPEQILHQGYAAIAAGFKGVGFWKQIPLDADVPGLNERRHAIRLFALHCEILQPWLATGRVKEDLPVRLNNQHPQAPRGTLAPLKSRWDKPIETISATGKDQQSEILATVIRSDYGLLILPVWYEEGEQCVPGPQAATGIRMLLTGDIWQAWEVSPVGVSQSNLEVSWPAGGTEIHLKNFDQHAAIVITNQPDVIERLQRDARRIRNDAAQAMVSLAALKFQRVQSVHDELVDLAPAIPQAELYLRQAYSFLETARKELESDHPQEAYASAQKSLQFLRSLQRQYWESANADLATVVTSLDAAGFQTLPDHWRMLKELGRSTRISPNLIPSGDFENATAIQQGWSDLSTPAGIKRIQRQQDRRREDSHLSLQLESNPEEAASIILTTPEVQVAAGDLIVITAQVRCPNPFGHAAENEFLMFDTLAGRLGAVRINQQMTDWETINIIRRVSQPQDFRVRLELHGNGTVDIDNLKVQRILP